MSNQSSLGYISANSPLFTRLYDTDYQYFNQLDSPVLSIFDHSVLNSLKSDVSHPYWNSQAVALISDGLTGPVGSTGSTGPIGPTGPSGMNGMTGDNPSIIDQISVFGNTTGDYIKDSRIYLQYDDITGKLNITDNIITSTDNDGCLIIGLQSCNNVTRMAGVTIVTPYSCANVTEIYDSTLIGTSILYNGANGVINDTIAIGVGYGSSGNLIPASAQQNCCVGNSCLFECTSGNQNSCFGNQSGNHLTSGAGNCCFGYTSGSSLTTGSGNIYINNVGVNTENDTIRIGTSQTKNYQSGIRGITTVNNDAIPVLVSSDGQLGTVSSSRKTKDNIKNITNSNIIYDMIPKQFNYIGQDKIRYGLIAEDIEKLGFDEMCIYQPNKETGERELLTLDYSILPIMLLKEVQKLKQQINDLQNN